MSITLAASEVGHDCATESGTVHRLRGILTTGDVGLALSLLALWVVHFQVMRGVLCWRNFDLAGDASLGTVLMAFAVGLRFDLAAAAYVVLPLLVLAGLARLGLGVSCQRRLLGLSSLAACVVLSVLGVAETEFYREFYTRFNSLAWQYWTQPATVLKMVWYGYPVLRLLLLAAVLATPMLYALRRAIGFWLCQPGDRARVGPRDVLAFSLLCGLLFVAARGGVRGSPLEWGDAMHGPSMFANHLAQNGMWMLGKAALARSHAAPAQWEEPLTLPAAQARTRELLGQAGGSAARERRVDLHRVSDVPPNVVVILMESFSARYVGAVGADDDYTPEFNKLARDGILFDRCFSAGTHTHQANVAVLGGFPTLPRHEALMEDYALGTQPLPSFPRLLKERGYSTTYLYNGDFSWENMEGFFRVQGMDRFIGRDAFSQLSYLGRTWGVHDHELYDRANREFSHARTPFFASILTLSNHAPFELPQPLPFAEETRKGVMNDRLNGIRYADWALGQFFERARREPYFENTLFVVVGDHGFSVAPILTELRLLRFHVPLLFYAPALLTGGPQRVHGVASHNDIIPTVMRLLGQTTPGGWGRDLFSAAADDPGLALFKPSEMSQEMGLARGDLLLVRASDGKFHGYRYGLGFPPLAESLPIAEHPELQAMRRDMQAYMVTAGTALCERRAQSVE